MSAKTLSQQKEYLISITVQVMQFRSRILFQMIVYMALLILPLMGILTALHLHQKWLGKLYLVFIFELFQISQILCASCSP